MKKKLQLFFLVSFIFSLCNAQSLTVVDLSSLSSTLRISDNNKYQLTGNGSVKDFTAIKIESGFTPTIQLKGCKWEVNNDTSYLITTSGTAGADIVFSGVSRFSSPNKGVAILHNGSGQIAFGNSGSAGDNLWTVSDSAIAVLNNSNGTVIVGIGAGIHTYSNTIVNAKNGTIIIKKEGYIYSRDSEAILNLLQGQINSYEGRIISNNGNAINMKGGILNIYDGGSINGTVFGVYASGAIINLYKGSVTGNNCAVYLTNGGSFYMSDGTLTGSKNSIYISKTARETVIYGGTLIGSDLSNIYSESDQDVVINNVRFHRSGVDKSYLIKGVNRSIIGNNKSTISEISSSNSDSIGIHFSGMKDAYAKTNRYIFSLSDFYDYNTVHIMNPDSLFRIKYHANGGIGSDYIQMSTSKAKLDKYANWFSAPENKIFVEWNTSSTGSGEKLTDNQENIFINKNIDLYAQWSITTNTQEILSKPNILVRDNGIKIEGLSVNSTYIIFTTLGAIVDKGTNVKSIELNLPKGIYIISIDNLKTRILIQ